MGAFDSHQATWTCTCVVWNCTHGLVDYITSVLFMQFTSKLHKQNVSTIFSGRLQTYIMSKYFHVFLWSVNKNPSFGLCASMNRSVVPINYEDYYHVCTDECCLWLLRQNSLLILHKHVSSFFALQSTLFSNGWKHTTQPLKLLSCFIRQVTIEAEIIWHVG